MPNHPEKRFALCVKMETFEPGLTRQQAGVEMQRDPKSSYCQAAVVLAYMAPGSVVVVSRDARGVGATIIDAQTQFEMWLAYTRILAADGGLPHAMQRFVNMTLENYQTELRR